MNKSEKCPRCGAQLSGQKLGGLCRHCVKKAVFEGLEEFEDDPAPTHVEGAEPRPDPFTRNDSQSDEALGQTIGRYKLRKKVGEGGCGVVYVAQQTEPVRRKVALKLIKLGMDTKQVVARFEAERQALAMMDHPNIARALDAGATESGRPYFVMELWDLEEEFEVWQVALEGKHRSVAFNRSGTQLAVGGPGTIWIHDTVTGERLLQLNAYTRGVNCVAFSFDEARLFSAGTDGNIKVWATTGEELITLSCPEGGECWHVAESPDGKTIASSHNDGTIRIWESTGAW